MKTQTKAAAFVGVFLVLALVGFLAVSQNNGDDGPVAAVDTSSQTEDNEIIRKDSRMLGEEGSSGVTFVEFLDFECEACGAAYPIVEDLREKYAGKVTFLIRYFPLPGHFNSERAARAVESAARQGELEAMYNKMYETQSSWGEAQVPKDDLFRSFAEEIGLDMKQYDADYASKEVADRIQRDLDDAEALKLTGTPTFYVDGELFQPQTVQDFTSVVEEALAK